MEANSVIAHVLDEISPTCISLSRCMKTSPDCWSSGHLFPWWQSAKETKRVVDNIQDLMPH